MVPAAEGIRWLEELIDKAAFLCLLREIVG
jgi:hypothetical protein